MKIDPVKPEKSGIALDIGAQKLGGWKSEAKTKPAAEDAVAPSSEDFDIAGDLALLGRALRSVTGIKYLLGLYATATIATLCINFGNVRLNKWNGNFFDAISHKDITKFFDLIGAFVPLVAVLLALTVTQTFAQERLKFRLREWISRHLLDEWLQPMRIYHLNFVGADGHNPDQRIQEDTKVIGDFTVDLLCGATGALIQMIAFIGVLWVLSTNVTFDIRDHHIAIPGYMVWCVLAYALIGSGLTYWVGRPLIGLNTERYAREAEFRYALVRANDFGESIALHGGEKDEQIYLETSLASVVNVMRRISTSLAQLTWITSGTGWISIIVPMLVAAPAYFQGNLTIGGLIMVTGAFTQVQGAMRWFVDNFSRLADWRSAIHRIARFRAALEDLPAIEEGVETITRSENPEGHLAFEGVRILRPDGQIVIHDASVKVMPGDRVLIVGETGAGKSTLFRAIAGLWHWGDGTILTPPVDSMTFLPQRPYLPLGTLRYALTYPTAADEIPDESVYDALERVGLEALIPRLEESGRWDKTLSLGEQQRLAFARLLLHKPSWVFLDEATSALDQESQHCVMTLFDDELKNTTLLSIGHRPDLGAYHKRTLQLEHDLNGDKLKIKSRTPQKPPPRWLRRATKWMPKPQSIDRSGSVP